MNARNREMTGVSDCVCTSTFCVRRSNSERDWTLLRRSATLHCRSIHASFVDFVQGVFLCLRFSYFSSPISYWFTVANSSGHRQFCLYDDVIKMSSWHNSWELIPAPKFCPSFFVYGCLVPWVPVPLKEDGYQRRQTELAKRFFGTTFQKAW